MHSSAPLRIRRRCCSLAAQRSVREGVGGSTVRSSAHAQCVCPWHVRRPAPPPSLCTVRGIRMYIKSVSRVEREPPRLGCPHRGPRVSLRIPSTPTTSTDAHHDISSSFCCCCCGLASRCYWQVFWLSSSSHLTSLLSSSPGGSARRVYDVLKLCTASDVKHLRRRQRLRTITARVC